MKLEVNKEEDNNMWASTPYYTKLLILAAETTVCIDLLLEDAELTRMLKEDTLYQDCIAYINDNW